MKITEQMSAHAYAIARDVYKGAITRGRGLARLVDQVHMNEASASSLIDNFRSMLNGGEYQRTMNYYTTNLYLKHIRSDFGEADFRNALLALEEHLDYYDSLEVGKHPKLRRLLAKRKQTLNAHCDTSTSPQVLINRRTDIHTVAKQCGTSITMIEKHYSYLTVFDKRDELIR